MILLRGSKESAVKTRGNLAESNFKCILTQADKLLPMPHSGIALCSGTRLAFDWNDLVRRRADFTS